MKDLGIEFAHIYSNQQFGEEQAASIQVLKQLERTIPPRKNVSRTVLIDDYSPNISIERFAFDSFIKNLNRHQAAPDAIVRESSLIPYCQRLIRAIRQPRIRKELERYLQNSQQYPCSLFIASWYLLRLGFFGRPRIPCMIGASDDLLSREIVNVVPDYFRPAEEKALEIITDVDESLLSKISHKYFSVKKRPYSSWSEFDPYEYEYRNYGRQILHEDSELIRAAIRGLQSMKLSKKSLARVLEIGTGPNIYPAMLLTPYLRRDGKIHLQDYAKPNIVFLREMLGQKKIDDWMKFEKVMVRSDGRQYQGAARTITRLGSVRRGDIYRLPKKYFDAGISFFVMESISDKKEKYHAALRSFMESMKPGAIFICAHMVRSKGYYAGENTFFPATDLDLEAIQASYLDWGECSTTLVHHRGYQPARKGYRGMVLVVGKRIA